MFLNFRGPDVRKGFVGHLYKSLVRSGIYTFKDDEELAKGESISTELLKAIRNSKIHLVVFPRATCHHLVALMSSCTFFDAERAAPGKWCSQFSTRFPHQMYADNVDRLVNPLINTVAVIQRASCSSGGKL